MSTLTYSHGHMPAAEADGSAGKTQRLGFWRRVLERLMTAQQRRADREIAAYLERRGGMLTDDTEREIMQRLTGRRSL